MGTEQNITVKNAANINQAIDLIGENSNLTFEIGYRLGIQGSYVQRVVERKNKEVSKLVKAYNAERTTLLKDTKEPTEEQKEAITVLNNTLNETVDALDDKEIPVKIIKFKSKDFMATEDITEYVDVKADGKVSTEKKIIKKGTSLVPIMFFKLMGELIEE